MGQVERWFKEFHIHLNLLKRDTLCGCGSCQSIGNLGLKVVAHYGEFAAYEIKKGSR